MFFDAVAVAIALTLDIAVTVAVTVILTITVAIPIAITYTLAIPIIVAIAIATLVVSSCCTSLPQDCQLAFQKQTGSGEAFPPFSCISFILLPCCSCHNQAQH
jgi:hypothetical protein